MFEQIPDNQGAKFSQFGVHTEREKPPNNDESMAIFLCKMVSTNRRPGLFNIDCFEFSQQKPNSYYNRDQFINSSIILLLQTINSTLRATQDENAKNNVLSIMFIINKQVRSNLLFRLILDLQRLIILMEISRQLLGYKLRKMEINGEEEGETEVLQRLDALPLSRWHIFVTLALGLVWIFDGYEVTLISLYRNEIVSESSENIFKSLVSAYQIGGIVGSLIFGVLAFIIGRRKIFVTTLLIYLVGVILSGIRTNSFLFIFSRFLTGLSVGGEFTAIFTAVDQFLPPKYRGRVNIGIDGTWHLGGTLASLLTMIVGETANWRLMFLFGVIGIFSLVLMRRGVPESPRWLLIKNRISESRIIIEQIEVAVKNNDFILKAASSETIEMEPVQKRQQKSIGQYLSIIFWIIVTAMRKQTKKLLVSSLLIFSQALFFNLVYYQYPDILANEFGLSQSEISMYMLPLAVVSFISTLFIGPSFDKIGRRKLLLFTYGLSGFMLIVSYQCHELVLRESAVVVLFVFASPASSSANLIASQIFSTSSRTIVLFLMFILSMLGGMCGVWFDNYLCAAIIMIFAGIVAFLFCPNAENKSLEQIQRMGA